MMNPGDVIAAVHTVSSALEHAPELVGALQDLLDRFRAKQELTPAIRHAEVIAAERFLGL